MATKRRKKKQKYRLKEEAKRFLVYFGVYALILLYAIVKCNDLIKEYKYQQTHEYKLLELGYTKDETSNLLNSINSKYLDAILAEEETNTFYTSLVSNQYYIKENYEEYLNYYEYHQTTDPKEIIGIINSKANLEWYSKIEKANYDTAPILVNKYYYIDETYEIKNLVNINLQSSYANNKAEEETVNATTTFLSLYIFFIILIMILVSFDGFSFEVVLNSVFTTFGNVGLAFEVGSFSIFSDFSTFVMTIGMLLGRLEIFPLIGLISSIKK